MTLSGIPFQRKTKCPENLVSRHEKEKLRSQVSSIKSRFALTPAPDPELKRKKNYIFLKTTHHKKF